jgi:hypothetical protein
MLLAALSLGAVLLFVPGGLAPVAVNDDLSPKGGAEILLWVESPEGPLPLHEDSVPRDTRLQLGLSAPSPAFVAGFARDAEQVVRLFPRDGLPHEFSPDAETPLGPSFRVDEGTSDLSLTVYISDEPFDVGALEASLRSGGDVEFPGVVLERKVRVRSR